LDDLFGHFGPVFGRVGLHLGALLGVGLGLGLDLGVALLEAPLPLLELFLEPVLGLVRPLDLLELVRPRWTCWWT